MSSAVISAKFMYCRTTPMRLSHAVLVRQVQHHRDASLDVLPPRLHKYYNEYCPAAEPGEVEAQVEADMETVRQILADLA
jgi:hypothetical protein